MGRGLAATPLRISCGVSIEGTGGQGSALHYRQILARIHGAVHIDHPWDRVRETGIANSSPIKRTLVAHSTIPVSVNSRRTCESSVCLPERDQPGSFTRLSPARRLLLPLSPRPHIL